LDQAELLMLAYVFWHRPADGVAPETYAASIERFHHSLAARPPAGFLRSATFEAPGPNWLGLEPAFEDWYVVEDFAALGVLNAAAVGRGHLSSHDAIARPCAGPGTGSIYRCSRAHRARAGAGRGLDREAARASRELKPADGRFGSGPSRVRPEQLADLAGAGRRADGHLAPAGAGQAARSAASARAARAVLAPPTATRSLLGNGGTTAFWDAATACGLVRERALHLTYGEFSSKFAACTKRRAVPADPIVIEAPSRARARAGRPIPAPT
jgi:hypothetical protein